MGSTRAGHIPLFKRLEIESQAYCNRACWFCPRTYDTSGAYLDADGQPVANHMPTDKLLGLLDEARDMGFAGPVCFHLFSEPVLDKRFPLLAREATKRGMKPFMHTNGDLLRHDDAACASVFDLYEYVVIGLYDYESNEELDAEQQYWHARLDGADVRFSTIGPSADRTVRTMGIPRALAPGDDRLSIPDLKYANAPCHRPLIRLIIRHDGTMCNCCEDVGGDFELGNVHERSLEELWYSDRHARVVEDLVSGRRERYALCRACPLSPTGPAPEGRRIEIARRRVGRP